MSHFTSVRTKIARREYLLAALEDMGHEVDESAEFIRGYYQGQRDEVEIKLAGHEVGFRQDGEHYVMVADWYSVHGLDQRKFAQELTQRYAYVAARGELEAQGFSLTDEVKADDGSVRLVLRRMA